MRQEVFYAAGSSVGKAVVAYFNLANMKTKETTG
jgi:hypothetical protein